MVARRIASRMTLVALFGLFFLPIVIAWVLNVYPGQWRPKDTINRGTLVVPVRDIHAQGLASVDHTPISADLLEGKWTLVFLGGEGVCQMECQRALNKMRQVRLALGKDMNRVQRVYAIEAQTSERSDRRTSDPGLEVVIANEQWVAPFSVDGRDPWAADRVYLLDPEGRLVMYYGPNIHGEGMLEDLERLLRYSKIGQ